MLEEDFDAEDVEAILESNEELRAELERVRFALDSESGRAENFYYRWKSAEVGHQAADAQLVEVEKQLHQVLERTRALEHLVSRLSQVENSRLWKLLQASGAAVRPVSRVVPQRLRKKVRRNYSVPIADQEGSAIQTGLPTVSVLMPVFNKGKTLVQTIDSLLAQTLTNWELIVWDDGSTDLHTQQLLDDLSIPNAKVFRSENQGVVSARNSAFRHASAPYIMCLDPDDLIAPTYLEKAVVALEEFVDVGFVYPWTRSFGGRNTDWRSIDTQSELMVRQNLVPIAAVMRREVFEETGGFSHVMDDGYEDWELWAHAVALGFKGKVIPEHLFLYRFDAVEGRDAAARLSHDEFQIRIGRMYGGLLNSKEDRPLRFFRGDIAVALEREVFFIPTGQQRPVVFFVPWLIKGGGGDQVVKDLTAGFIEQGRTVLICVTGEPPVGSIDITEEFLGLTPYVYSLPNIAQPRHWKQYVSALLQRTHNPVIINVGSTWLYQNLRELKSNCRGGATVIDELFNHVGHVGANVDVADEIDTTITVHTRLAELLREHYLVPSEIQTIYTGIEPPTRTRQRSARTKPKIGWLGRLSSEKRPEVFVALAEKIGDRADFLMAGSGPLIENTKRDVSDSNVQLLGVVESASEFLAEIDALVITSSIEGIPLAAMEAIALGTPVIATDVGGVRELIADGVNGFVVDPQDMGHLVETVDSLISEPGNLTDLQDNTSNSGLPPAFERNTMLQRFSELIGQDQT